MGLSLVLTSLTLNDLERPSFRVILHNTAAFGTSSVKLVAAINLYCQQQNVARESSSWRYTVWFMKDNARYLCAISAELVRF